MLLLLSWWWWWRSLRCCYAATRAFCVFLAYCFVVVRATLDVVVTVVVKVLLCIC